MAAYDFGYGYSSQPQPRAGGPGAYGYRPQYGYQNPFAAWRPSEVEWDYYDQNPQAVFGAYLNANPVGGPEGAAPDFRRFLEGWLPDVYREYEGIRPQMPETGFADWLGGQDPINAYELTNPYAKGLRAGYRTRYLRR